MRSVRKAFDRLALASGRPAGRAADAGAARAGRRATDSNVVQKTRLSRGAALAIAVGAARAGRPQHRALGRAGGAVVAVYAFVMAIAIAPVIVTEIRAEQARRAADRSDDAPPDSSGARWRRGRGRGD